MKVKFVPQNVEFEIEPGKSVMHVAQDHGLYIKSVCKGVPNCAECRVRVVEGDHNVMPPGSEELSLIGTGHFIDRRRLSCQLKCFGDITVDMTEQLAKQQGLVLGNKKKAALKDDRVEEAVARRGENAVDEETSSDANGDAVHQKAPHPSRDPRDARETRETRDTRPPGDQGRRDRAGNRGAPGGAPGGGRNGGRNARTQGGGDRSPRGARNPLPEHTPLEAAQDLGGISAPQSGSPAHPGRPGGPSTGGEARSPQQGRSQQPRAQGQQPNKQQNQQQRRPQQQPRPPRAEGEAEESMQAGAGGEPRGEGTGGKRRRRRRGKGGGGGAPGGGAPHGGAPSGSPSGGAPTRPGGGPAST